MNISKQPITFFRTNYRYINVNVIIKSTSDARSCILVVGKVLWINYGIMEKSTVLWKRLWYSCMSRLQSHLYFKLCYWKQIPWFLVHFLIEWYTVCIGVEIHKKNVEVISDLEWFVIFFLKSLSKETKNLRYMIHR